MLPRHPTLLALALTSVIVVVGTASSALAATSRRLTLLAIFAAAALAAVGGSAPTASAETTCLRDGPNVLYVFMSEHGDVTELKRYRTSTRINVMAKTGPIECAGDPPLVSDIDAIYIIDQSEDLSTAAGNDGSTRVVIGEPAALAPGKTIETTGASEIELLVDMKGGSDELIAGGDATQQLGHDIIVGQDGLSWTTDSDADMLGMPFPIVELRGDAERDQLSGQGGFGTGAPLSTARSFRVGGGPAGGNDLLRGSDILAGDDIAGGDGSQTIAAGAGNDRIRGSNGNDIIDGGPGSDTFHAAPDSEGLTLDLSVSGAQDTGEGLDTVVSVENASGGSSVDRLSGEPGSNIFRGGGGDDVLDGRGGPDVLLGQAGSDTASYDGASGPVTIDLGRILQPGEGDELFLVENVIGSPFSDVLTGDDQENRFVGGAGADIIAGAEEDDRIEVRDGERDRVDCGEDFDGPTLSDTDTAVSDRRTLDELTGCETVDALPEPTQPGDGGDGPTGPATPDTAVSLSLRVPSRQRLLRQRSVRLTVGCLDEACTTVTSAAGRVAGARISLGPLTVGVAPGAMRTLRLRLRPKQLSVLRRALAAGRRPRLRLTVRARDAAGNALERTVRVTARR